MILKNIIIVIALTIFCFADEKYNDDFTQDFDSEFTNNKVEVFDPLSGYNRLMTNFNDKVFINVLNPLAKGYAYVVPQTARIGVENFFDNLMYPVRLTNNLLQLKFQNSAEETVILL